VQERTVPTAALLPNPAMPVTPVCSTSLKSPQWIVGVTASAGTSNLSITGWHFDFFDHAGGLLNHQVLSSAQFAQFFTSCGPGNANVLAQTDACTAICLDLGGDTSGFAQITFSATDSAGRAVTFGTPRTTLAAK
jgi:hypothetical protein